MRHLKDLFLATRAAVAAAPALETPELEKALDAAENFLTESRTYEYTGKIKRNGTTVKLVDAGCDFDDAVKLLGDGKYDAEFHGEIYLIAYDNAPVTEPAPAAAAA